MSILADGQNLFVVDLSYRVALDRVEPLIPGHMAFLESCYAKGLFLASGPKVPRTGGVILAMASERSVVEDALKADPFHSEGVAEYHVTEFVPRMTAPGLK